VLWKHGHFGERGGLRSNGRGIQSGGCLHAGWGLVSSLGRLDKRGLFQIHCLWLQVCWSEESCQWVCRLGQAKFWEP